MADYLGIFFAVLLISIFIDLISSSKRDRLKRIDNKCKSHDWKTREDGTLVCDSCRYIAYSDDIFEDDV